MDNWPSSKIFHATDDPSRTASSVTRVRNILPRCSFMFHFNHRLLRSIVSIQSAFYPHRANRTIVPLHCFNDRATWQQSYHSGIQNLSTPRTGVTVPLHSLVVNRTTRASRTEESVNVLSAQFDFPWTPIDVLATTRLSELIVSLLGTSFARTLQTSAV